jgi:hypothetical protein
MIVNYRAAEWSQKEINDLPDSAFALIDKGGSKDEEGKTVPRTLRNLPHHKPDGSIDRPHLVNALARVTHTNLSRKQQKQAHDHLLKHYRELGMEHPKCSVPGSEGYEPKKSMLGDLEGFRGYQEAWLRANNRIAVVG